ncbi:MAG: hypothetical protein ACRC0V_02785, partial [Fusobacteriaceae bacterium]
DVLQVQKMAEYCNEENNSNFIAITHKDIFQYTNKLTRKENISEWEKVRGRFSKIHLSFESSTVLDILSESLHKNEQFFKYKETKKKQFKLYNHNLKNSGLNANSYDDIIDKFYPLNYIAAYILPDISQKVAQNERTLFSFVSSEEANSVKKLMEKEFLIGLDCIYDYFEENFRFLTLDSLEYKSFMNSKMLLSKVSDKLEKKLIKSLAVFYIYNKFSELEPTNENLLLSLNIDEKAFKELVFKLQEQNIIIYKRNFNHFKLVEDTDINIEKEVKVYIEEKLKNVNYSKLLNKYVSMREFYPLSYNEKFEINRFLGRYYVDLSEISELEKLEEIRDDGKIIYLLDLDKNINSNQIISSLRSKDFIFIKNKLEEKFDIKYFLKELQSIENLILSDIKFANGILLQEIQLYRKEIIQILNRELNKYFSETKSVIIIGQQTISLDLGLIKITKKYLEEKYLDFIPLNYELINKHQLSSQIKKTRIAIFNKILKNDLEIFEQSYYEKTGAENSVARIVLKNNNFINFETKAINFNLKFNLLQNEIIEKIKIKKYNVEEIYLDYCSNKSNYGFRRGFFTMILGLILVTHQDEIVVILNEGNLEQEITGELIEELEKKPQNYKLVFQKFSEEEKEYLNELEKLVINYSTKKSRRKSENIINAFRNYFYSLPRVVSDIYLKETLLLSKLIVGVFGDKNAAEFLLKEVPKRARLKDFDEVIKILRNDFISIKNNMKMLEEEIKNIIIGLLDSKENNGSILNLENKKNDFEIVINSLNIWKEKKEVSENAFQHWLKNYIFKNEEQFLKEITEKVKGFDYFNWTEISDLDDFNEKIKIQFNELIKSNENIKDIVEIKTETSLLKINLSKNLSSMGKILKKKLEADLKNMGITVLEEEKKKILLEMLMNI